MAQQGNGRLAMRLTPVPMLGDKNLANNFYPVLVPFIVTKMFEAIVHTLHIVAGSGRSHRLRKVLQAMIDMKAF